MGATKSRIVYLDFIKVFLTCMVVAHHAGQAYGDTGGTWLVSDGPKLDYLKSFFFFNAAYMMGLYFFISGYFTHYSAHNKPYKKYLKERFIRLGIPLIFFAFLIFGPLQFFLDNSTRNYFNFLADLHFNHPPLSLAHLWFVASLLAYSVIYLLIIRFLKIEIEFSKNFKFWYPLLYLLFLIPVNVLVRQSYPIDHCVTWIIPIEVAHLPQYFSLFLLGALFNKTGWLNTLRPRVSFAYMSLGLVLFFSKNFIYKELPYAWSESVVESFLCIGMCLGLISLFKISFNRMKGIIKVISDNAYGIYLFHLLVVIATQFLISNIKLDTNFKFIVASLSGIFISLLLSIVLRKINFMRKIL